MALLRVIRRWHLREGVSIREIAWLSGEPAQAGALDDLIGHSITYRSAIGPRAGQKVFALQTVPAQGEGEGRNGAAQAGGFSLHAGLEIQCGQRAKLERLCRYVSRPPVAAERLALTPSGQVRYALKTPYRDGTTHIVLEPLDFMARLAALVTPARRGIGARRPSVAAGEPAKPPTPRHVAMSWARRLQRVFGIEIEVCARCGGKLRIIASIEGPAVIARILAHLDRTCGGCTAAGRAPCSRCQDRWR